MTPWPIARALASLAVFSLAACASGDPGTARSPSTTAPWPSAAELVHLGLPGAGVRMLLVFRPALGDCAPQEGEVARAFARLTEELGDEVRIITLVPTSIRNLGDRYGGAVLPGDVIPSGSALDPRSPPLPAIEVWSGDGRLLLMKTIAANTREEVLYEEIFWLRSQTEPPSP